MIFEKLEEKYTKVSYAKSSQPIVEIVSNSSTYKKSFANLVPVIAMGSVFYLNLHDVALASGFTERAEKFYFDTFMMLAKWIIIIKGGWDVIAKTLKEDFEGAKKSIIQYLVVFVVLMGLPHALDLVEEIFSGEV